MMTYEERRKLSIEKIDEAFALAKDLSIKDIDDIIKRNINPECWNLFSGDFTNKESKIDIEVFTEIDYNHMYTNVTPEWIFKYRNKNGATIEEIKASIDRLVSYKHLVKILVTPDIGNPYEDYRPINYR
jgi:methionine synthase II (cobalamin-independent)